METNKRISNNLIFIANCVEGMGVASFNVLSGYFYGGAEEYREGRQFG
jgi:hypothetical protein